MASRDAFENNGQNHHTGDASIARLLSGPLRHLGHNNNSNIHDEVTEYLNTLVSVINLAQGTSGMERRDLQMHQTI